MWKMIAVTPVFTLWLKCCCEFKKRSSNEFWVGRITEFGLELVYDLCIYLIFPSCHGNKHSLCFHNPQNLTFVCFCLWCKASTYCWNHHFATLVWLSFTRINRQISARNKPEKGGGIKRLTEPVTMKTNGFTNGKLQKQPRRPRNWPGYAGKK